MRRKILFEGRRTRNAWLQQWRRHGASLSPHIPSWTPRFSDCMRRLYAKLGERAFSFAGSSSAGNAPSENLCAITDPAEFRKQLTPPTHTFRQAFVLWLLTFLVFKFFYTRVCSYSVASTRVQLWRGRGRYYAAAARDRIRVVTQPSGAPRHFLRSGPLPSDLK